MPWSGVPLVCRRSALTTTSTTKWSLAARSSEILDLKCLKRMIHRRETIVTAGSARQETLPASLPSTTSSHAPTGWLCKRTTLWKDRLPFPTHRTATLGATRSPARPWGATAYSYRLRNLPKQPPILRTSIMTTSNGLKHGELVGSLDCGTT